MSHSTARRCSTSTDDARTMAGSPTPPATAQTRSASRRRNRSARRPARRVEADVPRGLAHRARLLLRPESSRPRSARRPRSATSRISSNLGIARRSELSVRGDARRADRRPPLRRAAATRRTSKRVQTGLLGATTRSRTAGTGSPASTTARTGTRSSRAAHAARRQRRGRRVPAGGRTAATCAARQRLQLLRRHGRQAGRAEGRARSRRRAARAR